MDIKSSENSEKLNDVAFAQLKDPYKRKKKKKIQDKIIVCVRSSRVKMTKG